MLSRERQQRIMEMIRKTHIIKISEITEAFHVSNETARRDLDILESQNLVERIYGGATLISPAMSEPLFALREVVNHAGKAAIGLKACQLVNDGDTFILDVGTTTLELAKNLHNKRNINLLTNSLPIINELALTDVNLHVMGGKLNPNFLSMSGGLTLSALNQFFVDKAFLGAGGITFEDGLSDYNAEEAHIRKLTIARSKKIILLADSSKFGVNAFAMVCPIEKIDIIVTDWMIDPKIVDGLTERNIEVLIAKEDGT